MPPAFSASRAEVTPEASGHRSSGTFGNKEMIPFLPKVAMFISIATAVIAQTPDSTGKVRSMTSDSFRKTLRDAAIIDGKPGLTIQELEAILGKTDLIEDNSVLLKGIKHIFFLSDNRQLHAYLIDDSVSLAGITAKGKDDTILVWK